MKKTAVVILNWNGKKLLEQFLPSVARFTSMEGVEIVVADNCSSDDSASFLAGVYPHVKLIQLSENYGYAEGYNKALKEIEADYFVLLNSDVEVTEGWLKPMVDYLDQHPNVAAMQPKIKAYNNKTHFEYAGAAGGYIDKYGYPFCRGRIFGDLEEDRGQYDSVIDIFWASGACMLIRSLDFFDAGGLDSSFFAHMEEIDLCWRLNARGRQIVCFPHSVVYHVGGATLTEESSKKTFLNFRNNLLMLYKNLPKKALSGIIRKRIILDYIAAARYTLTGKLANAEAIVKAHEEFKEIKSLYDAARAENMQKATLNVIDTIYPQSILNRHYVKGIKNFSELKDFSVHKST